MSGEKGEIWLWGQREGTCRNHIPTLVQLIVILCVVTHVQIGAQQHENI
jgi:hypothetical protein